MEKNMKWNMCVCVCVCVSHFPVHQKLTQHCKSTILQPKKRKYCCLAVKNSVS